MQRERDLFDGKGAIGVGGQRQRQLLDRQDRLRRRLAHAVRPDISVRSVPGYAASAMPSLRWSDAPYMKPRMESTCTAWKPPSGSSAQVTRWPRALRSSATARGDRRFERQRAVKGEAARRVRGLLDVEAAVEHAAQDLHVSRGLILSAHHAKCHDGFAVLRQQARNDGVEGTFSRRDGVGMALDEAETRAAVLQQHARTRAHRCRCRRRRTAN